MLESSECMVIELGVNLVNVLEGYRRTTFMLLDVSTMTSLTLSGADQQYHPAMIGSISPRH